MFCTDGHTVPGAEITPWRTTDVNGRAVAKFAADGCILEVPATLLRRVSGADKAKQDAFFDLMPRRSGKIRIPYVTFGGSKHHPGRGVSLVPVRAGFAQDNSEARMVTYVILHDDQTGRTMQCDGLTFESCSQPIYVARTNCTNRLYLYSSTCPQTAQARVTDSFPQVQVSTKRHLR